MTENSYTTKEIADRVGIHPNTLRFYEEIGFITKPERRKNGYRSFTELHLDQCRLIRLAMRAEVLQNGLRKQAVLIIRLCAELKPDSAVNAAEEYIQMTEREIAGAKAAISAVEGILANKHGETLSLFKRREAAKQLGVTPETLRTWERSGLLRINRLENGYRVYNGADMDRLNIIRTLRCAGYSLSSILRLLNGLDQRVDGSVESLLNTPRPEEDIISVCDRLILSLNNTGADAVKIKEMTVKIAEKYLTIQ